MAHRAVWLTIWADGGNLQVKPGTDIVLVPQPNLDDPNDPLVRPQPRLAWPDRTQLTLLDMVIEEENGRILCHLDVLWSHQFRHQWHFSRLRAAGRRV